MNLTNIASQHGFGGVKIGNHPIVKRPDNFNQFGRLTNHFFSLRTNRQNLLRFLLASHYRRFMDNNPLTLDQNHRIGCAKINTQIVRH